MTILPLFAAVTLAAQSVPPVVEAALEPDSIAIGDHFTLSVEVDKDIVQMVIFPLYEDNMMGPLEILEEGPVDTLSREGRRIRLAKKYRMTTFEEGDFDLGRYPVLYIDKNITDTIYSREPLHLQVGTFEIDTLTMTIYDIKGQMKAPLKFGEISMYLLWAVIGLVLCGVLLWLFIRYRKDLPGKGRIFKKPAEPPHISAIRALEVLQSQKVWQSNKHKAYYTALTDILREYIEGRYGVHAMEMTSDEILEAVKNLELTEKSKADLSALLSTADLVKFAKYTPEADSNEAAWYKAYYFVEETKLMEPDPEHGAEKEI